MPERFKATLRLKPQRYKWGNQFTLEDVNTGEEYCVFPTELAQLLENLEIEGIWAHTSRGGVPSIRPIKDN